MKPVPTPRARRERAWGLVIANQLALPGIGSVLAGRKVGWLQLAFSLTGIGCMTVFLAFAIPRMGDWLNPPEDPELVFAVFEKWRPWLMLSVIGIGLVAFSWVWSLGTSRQVLKESSDRRNQP